MHPVSRRFVPVLVALVFTAHNAMAGDKPVIPPHQLVFCTVCHGVQLKGNPVIQAPRLSGMAKWYVKRQLLAFKHGWRGTHKGDVYGVEMQPMAASLSAATINDAARYVAAVGSEPPPATVHGNANRGRSLYASCVACHGTEGEGNEALGGPALVGLNDWYLARQLRNFREGIRGSHPDDTYGNQMRSAAQVLKNNEAIEDVVTYINSLQTNRE